MEKKETLKLKLIKSLTILIVLQLILVSCGKQEISFNKEVLSPENWTKSQWSIAHTSMTDSLGAIAGDSIMIINTGSSISSFSGFQVLEQGGTAIDAAIATALTDITLETGQGVSFAGICNLLYYEAKTGKVYSMNAGWNTPLQENDPKSIPDFMSMVPSGRTALVPGFLKGLESAHDKFGKLPFDALFESSIYFAENGIEVNQGLKFRMDMWKEILARLPETKEIFTDKDGNWLQPGDTLKQPKLANSLRKMASQGSVYMYNGEWAKRFVETIQKEGGHLSIEDLQQYDVIWDTPAHTNYRGYDLFGLATPSNGGINTIEAMNVLEQIDIRKLGHYTESSESLFALLRASRIADILGTSFTNSPLDTAVRKRYFPNLSVNPSDRVTKEHAQNLMANIKSSEWNKMIEEDQMAKSNLNTGHSHAIVAIDQYGNMVSLIHSSNTMFWGRSGIFIDGISIPDPGATNQEEIEMAGPGKRLPEATSPLIVLKENKPFLASNAISMGVHEITIQNTVNILDFNMTPSEANLSPHFAPPLLQSPSVFEFAKTFIPFEGEPQGPHVQTVTANTFSRGLLENVRAKGEPLEELPFYWYDTVKGMWIGIRVDSESGKLEGAIVDGQTGSGNTRKIN